VQSGAWLSRRFLTVVPTANKSVSEAATAHSQKVMGKIKIKNMKLKLTTLSLLVILLSSCNHSNFEPDGKVIIAGKILNFEKHKEVENFNLFHHDLLELQIIETVEIKDDGSFQISIPCYSKMDLFIIFGKVPAYLICVPNDSLFLTIDADILNDPQNKYPNDSYFAKVIGGTRVTDNQFVNEFIRKTRNTLSRAAYFKIIETYSPLDYLAYQNNIEDMEMSVLDSLLQTTDAAVFKTWAEDFTKYKKLDLLLQYPAIHAKENNINIDSLEIPQEYFTEIFKEDINDNEFFSFYHTAFLLYSYNNHLYRQARKEGLDLLQYINTNSTGFSKDFALARYFYSLNKKSDTLAEINSELIKNKFLKNFLILEINKQETKKAERLEIKTHSTFVDSLFSKYKGKVVYVDFWATWCVPCLKEFPYSMTLIDQFKDKPIEFLFLCNRSTKENWQKTITEKELKGTHVFLNDKQYTELQTLFGIEGIPHYVFVNKQGGFINRTLRPSDKNIVTKINELLNE